MEIGIALAEENKKTKRKEKRGPGWEGVVGKLNKLAGLKRLPEETLPA